VCISLPQQSQLLPGEDCEVTDSYSYREKDKAVAILRGLHVVQITVPSNQKPQEMQLTTNFKNSLRMALEGRGNHKSFGVPSLLPIPPETDIKFLDNYAGGKWEGILHYVVNSVGRAVVHDSNGPKGSVKDFLLAGRLIERRAGTSGISITKAGFTFLLQDINTQVWTLLLLWLEGNDVAATETGLDTVDMLSFLFMLASLELGKAYDTNSLTEQRKNMLPALVDFGLIYIPNHKPQQYFPTRLATSLTSNTSSLRSVSETMAVATAAARRFTNGTASPAPGPTTAATQAAATNNGSIIIETNFRMYAYTSSPLQIAILALFSRLGTRFPDMVSGRLTRRSMRKAIVEHGITADQIIGYLSAHAHERMRRHARENNVPVLPPTVVDQIRLWQIESERMQTSEGFLFMEFSGPEEYEAVAGFAEQIGVLVWRNDGKGRFFASKVEQIKDYLKLRKKAGE
jgi:transcription initiation factor TFIIH subunit 4